MNKKLLIFTKRAFFLATAFVFALGLCFSSAAEDEEYDIYDSPVPQKMLVMGDSIATGYGLEGYDKGRENVESYSNLLAGDYKDELPAGEEQLTNLAMDGQTSKELLDDLLKGDYDDYLTSTDIVLISIGGNDLLGALFSFLSEQQGKGINVRDLFSDMSLLDIAKLTAGLNSALNNNIDSFGENLEDIANYITNRTDARIIIQNVYNPIDNAGLSKLFTAFVGSKIDDLNEQIDKCALSDDGTVFYTVADVHSAFSGQGKELTNFDKQDIHPNSYGHRAIYDTLDRLIRETGYSIKVPKPVAAQSDNLLIPDDDSPVNSVTKLVILAVSAVLVICAAVAVVVILRKRNTK